MRISILLLFASICWQCQPSSKEKSNHTYLEEADTFLDTIQLEEKELISKIKIEQNEWVIIAGRSCKDCDENTSLYLFSTNSFPGSDSIKSTRYSFPGKLYSFDDSVIFEARAFYGECLPDFKKIIVWTQKQQTGDGMWKESTYVVELQDESINEKVINKNMLKEILGTIKENKCFEIAGRDQTAEP